MYCSGLNMLCPQLQFMYCSIARYYVKRARAPWERKSFMPQDDGAGEGGKTE